MSRISTFSPTAASAVPRLMAVVVLPTPPFWLATTRTRATRLSGAVAGLSCDTLQLPDLKDDAGWVRTAGVLLGLDFPRFMGLRQFGRYILSLVEESAAPLSPESLCIREQ